MFKIFTSNAPLLVYLLGFVFAATSIFKPRYGLYFIVLIAPFRVLITKLQPFPMGKDLLDILLLAIIIGTLISSEKSKEQNSTVGDKTDIIRWFKIYMVFLVFSLFYGSLYWGLGLPLSLGDTRLLELKNHIMLPIICILSYRLITKQKDILIMVIVVLLVLFLADLDFIRDNRQRSFSAFSWDYKDAGIFEMLGGNVLAAFLANMFFLPLGLLLYEKRIVLKSIYGGLVAATLYPVFFLFSRGAYFGLFAGMLFVGFRKSKGLLIFLFCLPIIWTSVLPDSVIERIEMTQNAEGELDHSSERRLELWQDCLKYFASNPIFGVGYNTFHVEHRTTADPHNAYMEILAEQGLIGIFLFLAFITTTLKNSIWLQTNSKNMAIQGLGLGVGGVTVCFAVVNLFGDRWSYLEVSITLITLMAIVARARKIIERENSDSTSSSMEIAPPLKEQLSTS